MTPAEISGATAVEIVAAVAGRRTSARHVITATLDYISARDGIINAFTDVTRDRALRQADAIDRKISAGQDAGPLAGVPFAAKNLFDIAGLPTRAGSKINRNRPPAAKDATLISRLEDAGAVLVGGLNMGEYAYDFTGENAHDGNVHNPHDVAHMAGGSSSGSGAAVAGGMVPFTLGSDTNGSIRVPSAFCGLFGLKPTYGRLSRAHTFPFVASFDHLGPIGRSVSDIALCYDAMQGSDPGDPCTDRVIEPAFPETVKGIAGLRIGVARGYFARGGDADAFRAVQLCAEGLNTTRDVDIPEAASARAAAYVITASEGAALHLDRLRSRAGDFDPAVRDRLIAGAMTPATWVQKAQRFRRWYYTQVMTLFEDVDVILAPSTPCRAPKLGQKTFTLDGVEMPVRPNIGIYTQPISFIGLPVVAVPVWLDHGLPLGVQVIAKPWREDLALRVARHLERQGVAQARIA